MPTWFSASAGQPVAELVRDGKVESVHHGIVAVANATGEIVRQWGNPQAAVYPRSTLKPLQTLTVLETGVELSDLEVALATASHSGSAAHRLAVSDFLLRHQLSQSLLQCPRDWPLDREERAQMVAGGETEPIQLAMNCSGKHTGFLAACQHMGWDLASYLDADHPLQRAIVKTVEEYTGESISFSSTDGCGAPLHAVSVAGLAKAMSRLVSEDHPHSKKILTAVSLHPWAIDGEGRPNTLVIERLGGIAKIGAEGLVVIAVPSGVAVAVKIVDGSMRATTPVALEALKQVGAIESSSADALTQLTTERVFGGSQVLGSLRVTLG